MKKIFYVFLFLTAMPLQKLSAQAGSGNIKPKLNHIAVYVIDLENSTRFYRQVIHLDTVPEPFHDGRHTWFAIGANSRLHIIQGAKDLTTHDKNNHLCFSVSSVTDFVKTLDDSKIEYENWAGQKMAVTKRIDGVFQIYFKDPDGYWIEINNAED